MSTTSRWLGRTLLRVLGCTVLILRGPYLLYSTLKRAGYDTLYDFKGGLYNAGVAILHGRDPYQAAFLAHQAALMRAGHVAIGETTAHPFSIPVYPAIANLLVVPFSALPLWAGGLLYSLLSVAAMVGALRLLGVRDWRCHALALFSWPFMFGLFLGAIGPFLVLGLAVAWRWRERLWRPALAIALIVAVKVFPWTLGVWLLITRRYKAFLISLAAGVIITFGAWALIGFDGMSQYPQMLSNMSFIQEGRAVSVVGTLVILGVSSSLATAIAILLGGLILLLAWRLASGPDGDRRAFGLAVLAALTATPIVWDHYMVLLFVPIALASPQLSAAWLIPVSYPLIASMTGLIPGSSAANVPLSTNTLRGSFTWLALELVTGIVLCTTPEQRRALLRGRRWTTPTPGEPIPLPSVAAETV